MLSGAFTTGLSSYFLTDTAALLQFAEQSWGEIKVQHPSDYLRPAGHKTEPAIFNHNSTAFGLGKCLMHEGRLAAVVESPGDAACPSRVIGEPGVPLPMPVALMMTPYGGKSHMILSLTAGSAFCMYSLSISDFKL
ncbi:MAG: hypothetical protein MUO23_13500 [Anaerolineales bacterium]|nr:hypothetical protein [Anaerolineales bacterium]